MFVAPLPPKKTHAFVTFLLFVLCMGLLPSGTTGFATVKSNLKNQTRTKTFFMTPLQMDESFGFGKLAATSSSSSSEASSSPPPRGIVLNASIGLTVFLGGLMGFVTKQSKASLIAGSTFGGALGLSSILIAMGNSKGNWVGGIVSTLLTYVMGKKFLKAYKFMPAGLVATMAISGMIYNFVELRGRGGKTPPQQRQEDDDTHHNHYQGSSPPEQEEDSSSSTA